jgi:hypothetical protein
MRECVGSVGRIGQQGASITVVDAAGVVVNLAFVVAAAGVDLVTLKRQGAAAVVESLDGMGAVGINDRKGCGDGHEDDCRRGIDHAAAGTRNGEDVDRRGGGWRGVLGLRGADLRGHRAGLGLSGWQRRTRGRQALDVM